LRRSRAIGIDAPQLVCSAARPSIYELFPLVCPTCGGRMRSIAFITDAATVRDLLAHLDEPTAPPRIAPARGPPLWEAADAECIDPGRPWDPSAQPEPAYEFDQHIAW